MTMRSPRIVFLDAATLTAPIRRPADAHVWENFSATGQDEVRARIADADIVILNKVKLSRDLIDVAERLSLVLIAATGTDNVDTKALQERNIAWHNVVGYGATSVAEHVMALLLTLRRKIINYRDAVKVGRWQEVGQFCFHDYPIRELDGSTLVIIGGGAIGQRVASLASAFGVEVVLAERKGESVREGRVAFDEAMRGADIISLHCPLNSETYHLFNANAFAVMKRQPILINTARGALIEPSALVAAIEDGTISGAGLDVLETEPPAATDPLATLNNYPNVILTPHVAWAGQGAQKIIAESIASQIDDWFEERRD